MNKNIQILHWHTGSVLFEHEQENNTLKDTIVDAIEKGADIRCADLHCADLRGVDLRCADLRGVDLRGVDLRGANLSGANLSGANLRDADLRSADLHGTDLRGADLRNAILFNANLCRANFRGTDLRYVDLHDVDLHDVDLTYADLRGANLRDANLTNTKGLEDYPLACPSDGAFIGWKKVRGCLVKLEIQEDAKRSSATTNKCRCDKAKVLAITDLDGKNPITEIENTTYEPLTYKVGEMVYPDSFDNNRWNECSHGIHFFINKQDAIDY